MTEQDKADLIAVCSALFWGPRPFPAEIEEAYQRIRGRFDLAKVYKTYCDATLKAAAEVVFGAENIP